MTAVSSDLAGAANFTVIRDWRRSLEKLIKSEGRAEFYQATLPWVGMQEAITLVTSFARPNGDRAIVIGSPSYLWRYFSTAEGLYIDAGYIVDGYYADYSNTFQAVGSGFAGHRWEAVDTDGTLILNNGVDLPVSLRVERMQAEPLKELREQGVASVGTIGLANGMLHAGDITMMDPADLTTLLTITDSGTLTAAVPGPTRSEFITATVSSVTVTATGAIFVIGMVGKTIRFGNGTRRVIATYVSPTVVTVTVAATLGAMRFDVLNAGTTDRTVTASGNFFTSEMVGQRIIWDTGQSRLIKSYVSQTQVITDDDTPILAALFGVTSDDAYGVWTGEGVRVPYRDLWSMNDAPTRFNAAVPGQIVSGARELLLDYPSDSFPIGSEIIVLGAGPLGGNLITTVLAVNGRILLLEEAASTSIENTPVAQSDTIGSASGYEDIQDDGSAILRMLELRGVLIVYKATSIFIGQYTGNRLAPWTFVKAYGDTEGATSETQQKALFYRNTLISANGLFHFYVGRSSFYRFELTTRVPQEIPQYESCKNLFFDIAAIADTDYIFSADNALTKEIWLCMPPILGGLEEATSYVPEGIGSTSPSDKVIRFDYQYGTVSTSPERISAGATVLTPGDDSERLFLMGLVNGNIHRYGLREKRPLFSGTITAIRNTETVTSIVPIFTADMVGCSIQFNDVNRTTFPITEFTDSTHVEYRQAGATTSAVATTFTILYGYWVRDRDTGPPEPYASVLKSGLEGWNYPFKEKTIGDYVLNLASHSPNVPVAFKLYGANNANNTPRLLGSTTISNPGANGLVPMHFEEVYTQDELTETGYGPCEIASRIFQVEVPGSEINRYGNT